MSVQFVVVIYSYLCITVICIYIDKTDIINYDNT